MKGEEIGIEEYKRRKKVKEEGEGTSATEGTRGFAGKYLWHGHHVTLLDGKQGLMEVQIQR